MTTLNLDYETGAAYYGDCADIMAAWKSKGVQGIIDLIYLDPPFNSNRNYGAPTAKSKESDTGSMDAFVDMWTYDARAYERTERICKATAHPACELIGGLRGYLEKRDDGMLAYLTYMADRLWLLHGLLKETGSIYLHCDPSANYYLRMLMDSVFGAKNFRNEIVWKRTSSRMAKHKHPSVHDTILFYANAKHKPNKIFTDHDPEYIRKFYRQEDKFGLYMIESLAGPGVTQKGDSGKPWRGVDPGKVGRHWAMPGTFPSHVAKPTNWNEMPIHEKLDYLDSSGLIYWPPKGSTPRFKRYLSTSRGRVMNDMILDVPPLSAQSEEKMGYPTQKPLKLLDRIIRASTNEGDVVLDPFCGCGTALHSAFQLNRRFIGIDVSVFSVYSVTKKRLKNKCGIDVPIYGIPTNIEGAKLLAKQDWESFEAWAAESLNFGDIGILSNKIKRCDGGIDGKGRLYGKTADGEDEVIVQVKGGAPSIDQVKAFAQIIQSNPRVAAGIFITLDEKDWTAGMEKWAQSLGTFTMPDGTRSFRRLHHWPITDRFKREGEGEYPKMPIMVNPLNGKPLVNIGHTF